MLEFFWIVA